MKIAKVGIVVVSVGLCLVGCGAADDGASEVNGFREGDRRGNRAHREGVDASELQAMAFAVDGGGSSDVPSGLEAKVEEIRQKLLAKYDTNADGKLDEAERRVAIDAMSKKLQAKLDPNGDGKVSEEELRALEQEVARKWKEFKAKNPEDAAKIEKHACEGLQAVIAHLGAQGKDPSKSKLLAKALSKCAAK